MGKNKKRNIVRCEYGIDYQSGHYDCNFISNFVVNGTPYCCAHLPVAWIVAYITSGKFPEIGKPIEQTDFYNPPPIKLKRKSDFNGLHYMRIQLMKKLAKEREINILLSNKNKRYPIIKYFENIMIKSNMKVIPFIVIENKSMNKDKYDFMLDLIYNDLVVINDNNKKRYIITADEYEYYK